jgi:hypothetical protein
VKVEPPPKAPHGSGPVMKAYNDLRDYIMGRQVANVTGDVKDVNIVTTPSGKFISIGEIVGLTGAGGPGACCNPTTFVCTVLSGDDCAAASGTYLGAGVSCTPDPCAGGGFVIDACCHGASCSTTSMAACGSSGGTFIGAGIPCTGGLCLGTGGMGACCDGVGGCTSTVLGACGGTWHSGGCDSGICGPSEPTGACCAGPTTPCAVTSFGGCGGIFHEGVDCSFVGSCEHDFCGPEFNWCACDRAGAMCVPALHSPPCTSEPVPCASCAVPGVPGSYCCCACCWTAFGPQCSWCGG